VGVSGCHAADSIPTRPRLIDSTDFPVWPCLCRSRSPFINADGAYLLACANARKSYIKNNDLIGVVNSYFPSTPFSKYRARFVGQPEVRPAPSFIHSSAPP